jgi:hypothetical protein
VNEHGIACSSYFSESAQTRKKTDHRVAFFSYYDEVVAASAEFARK